ncbi:GerAB/ArcD/ProY family transporter [Paenibacillus sp. MMS18-CY102]|uniref:GerAB/ArcD/ProY family transporter n=1 Tax=Paenibacillus sp. MMS18-CY102 TaxID=2682849 RepID=UPI001365F28B|nr:endospore germination permease [Paenibacillus sp. MMS18-CY102]MWC29454.1 endospore germination permease [Paenibacillus sp. MMS18-CY102]
MRETSFGERPLTPLEMSMTIASMLIGVGILSLPRALAKETVAFDGWISIVLAGGVAMLLGMLVTKTAVRTGGQPFLEYASSLISRPLACVLAVLQGLYFMGFCAYETRAIADISKQYLFNRTPVEYVSLAFILVIVYAASGSRSGILRLNVLFLPAVLLVVGIVVLFGYRWFEVENLQPLVVTSFSGILKGAKEVIFSLLGFEIILYYIAFMDKPEKAGKAVMAGITVPVVVYLVIYQLAIGIFSNIGTVNIVYPTIELAKEINFPGNFFERFESLFFVIWIMTVFNTAAMGFDLATECLSFLFKRLTKRVRIVILAPIIYLVCMFPQNMSEFSMLGTLISYFAVSFGITIPILLLLLGRGKKGAAKHGNGSA